MARSEDDIPPPPPPSQTPTQQTSHTVSTIRLPILKKGEYDIWAIKWNIIWLPYRLSYLGSYSKRKLSRECLNSIQMMQKESVSKHGRKSAKVEPSVHKDPLFDELPDDTLDYMDTKDAQDVGRIRDVVNKEKESAEDAVSTEGVVSTDKEKVSTDRPNVSTDKPKVNTDKEKDSTVSPD
ncbi:hypothetical protein Tco_0136315, partial [Tanacetum coccineum]